MRGVLTSAIRIALAVGVVVATANSFSASGRVDRSDGRGVLKMLRGPTGDDEPSVEPRQHRPAPTTDTQYGRSTSRLAAAFSAHFDPVAEEEAVVDYSF